MLPYLFTTVLPAVLFAGGISANSLLPCLSQLSWAPPRRAVIRSYLRFQLDFTPSDFPCASNLSLNTAVVAPNHRRDGPILYGSGSFPSSGHGLNVWWRSICVTESDAAANQILTVTVQAVDSQDVQSLSGFTLSFNNVAPEFLRFADYPAYDAIDNPSEWSNPPPSLRISAVEPESQTSEPGLQEHIDDLRHLEAELEYIQHLINKKTNLIKTNFHSELKGLKGEISRCDGIFCIFKAILKKAHHAAHMVFQKFRPNPYVGGPGKNNQQALARIMNSSEVSFPSRPSDCHCKDGKPSEKQPLPSGAPDDSFHLPEHEFPKSEHRSMLHLVLKILLWVTGVMIIIKLTRRCCSCGGHRQSKARRERRAAERAIRRSAQRQRVTDWWQGCERGGYSRRQSDADEKAALVAPQEGVLEAVMRDEIRQLQIQEEIRQLRDTRDVVDELVRAEEGRGTIYASYPYVSHPPPPSSASSSTAPPAYPAGFAPLPIAIPQRTSDHHLVHQPPIPSPSPASVSSSTPSEAPFSPLSRTTSLPSYRSKPPSYREDEDEDDAQSDGFSDDVSLRTSVDGDDPGEWSPGSSIPDLSPRPSGETVRTFV